MPRMFIDCSCLPSLRGSSGGCVSSLLARHLEVFHRNPTQCLGQPLGELQVGDQGHAEIHSGAPDDVVVGELFLLVVSWGC